MKKIELLAPARTAESGIIAVDHGADAVYIGGPSFGARSSATNTFAEIARLCEYARKYRVRVYAALNTLIYEEELETARAVATGLIEAGVDALIVQDMAFLRMGLPPVEFHASTQTCVTDAAKVEFLREAGFSRVILERGLDLDTIREIASVPGIQAEVFVHGAICVGHSGRCYLSRSMGPRSGNRGDCMQACRLKYDLVDPAGNALVTSKHLLSAKDLCLEERLGVLIDGGVTSFKIEGRLKDDAYLKNIVLHYRRRLDREISVRNLVKSSEGEVYSNIETDPVKSFSRDFTEWNFSGAVDNASVFDTPKATGQYMGSVSTIDRNGIKLDRQTDVRTGDGVCWVAGNELRGSQVVGVGPNGSIRLDSDEGINKGIRIYRNYNRDFISLLNGSKTLRRIPVVGNLKISSDVMELCYHDAYGNKAAGSLAASGDYARSEESYLAGLQKQLQKSGKPEFEITAMAVQRCQGPLPFFPVATLNSLRRTTLEKLSKVRSERLRVKSNGQEQVAFPYPYPGEAGLLNITNSLSARFYADHSVADIEDGYDLRDNFNGLPVLQTPYCVLKQAGICSGPRQCRGQRSGPYYLVRGKKRYRIETLCPRCGMRLIADEEKTDYDEK